MSVIVGIDFGAQSCKVAQTYRLLSSLRSQNSIPPLSNRLLPPYSVNALENFQISKIALILVDQGEPPSLLAVKSCAQHYIHSQEVVLFTSVVLYKDFNLNLFKHFIGKGIDDFLPGEYEKEKKFFGPFTSLLVVNKNSKDFSFEVSCNALTLLLDLTNIQ